MGENVEARLAQRRGHDLEQNMVLERAAGKRHGIPVYLFVRAGRDALDLSRPALAPSRGESAAPSLCRNARRKPPMMLCHIGEGSSCKRSFGKRRMPNR
jgi:hypothetical protein